MKILITTLFIIFSINSFATNNGFLGNLSQVLDIAHNGMFSPGGCGVFCSDSGGGFAPLKCPTYAKKLISKHINYGITGWFNSEKKFQQCFKNTYRPDMLTLKQLSSIAQNN
ncbi:MAG: hypothetical protein KAI17_00870, partial [Thiotrichaceae bacterium]|nr:hypothetical protein [Thiotrichaceae bacterium]